MKITGQAQELYKLRCKGGVLKTHFLASDLEHFSGSFNIPLRGWEDTPIVSLREAAKVQAPWNVFVENRCHCKPGTCKTKRCKCFKKKIDCSSHCHGGLSCNNKKFSEVVANKEDNQHETGTKRERTYTSNYYQQSLKSKRIKMEDNVTVCKCKNKERCVCGKDKFCSKKCHSNHSCTDSSNQEALKSTIDLTNSTSTCTRQKLSKWVSVKNVVLYDSHKNILDSSTSWLDDLIVHAAQTLLKIQFPMIGSL